MMYNLLKISILQDFDSSYLLAQYFQFLHICHKILVLYFLSIYAGHHDSVLNLN